MNWIKVGTKVRCINAWTMPNPLTTEPFTIEVGTTAEILSIGPGEARGPDGKWYFVGVGTNRGDIVLGWFDFGQGDHAKGFVSLIRGDLDYYWEALGDIATARARPQRNMIVDRHPSRPGVEVQQRHIGYWASSLDPDADSYAQRDILLPHPDDFVDESWDAGERSRMVQYLKSAPAVQHWRGSSRCRFGCQIQNGSRDHGDGTFVWPEGFAHYVEVHGVRPAAEFVEHVWRSTV